MFTLMQVFGWMSLLGLALFLFLYHKNPTSLVNGFVFDCDLVVLVGALFCALFVSRLNALGGILLFVLLAIVLFLAVGGIWLLIGFLLLNAFEVFRRERRTLQNMLSLLLGLGLLGQIIALLASHSLWKTPAYLLGTGLLLVVEAWLVFTAVCFITTSLLCQIDRPRLSTDYIIVLGSGLLRGCEVSPLLAGRIDRAIDFYRKALAKNQHPKLVFSGGQGADETISEAEAMRAYALAHGVSAGDALLENQSRNTLENFRFSRAVMDADAAGKAYRCAYATSDYHVLRARILARTAGLPRAKGLGARTAFYYVTNATIREYIAVMLTNRKNCLLQLGFLAGVYLLFAVAAFF